VGFVVIYPVVTKTCLAITTKSIFFLPQVTCQYATKNYTNATSFLHKTMISRSVWFVASHVIMLNTLFRTWMMQRGMLEQDSGIHCCHGCLARCLINHFTACAVRSVRVVPCASHSTARQCATSTVVHACMSSHLLISSARSAATPSSPPSPW
jgi:hypothetical protein